MTSQNGMVSLVFHADSIWSRLQSRSVVLFMCDVLYFTAGRTAEVA